MNGSCLIGRQHWRPKAGRQKQFVAGNNITSLSILVAAGFLGGRGSQDLFLHIEYYLCNFSAACCAFCNPIATG